VLAGTCFVSEIVMGSAKFGVWKGGATKVGGGGGYDFASESCKPASLGLILLAGSLIYRQAPHNEVSVNDGPRIRR
jgi:hypothetical protein